MLKHILRKIAEKFMDVSDATVEQKQADTNTAVIGESLLKDKTNEKNEVSNNYNYPQNEMEHERHKRIAEVAGVEIEEVPDLIERTYKAHLQAHQKLESS